jgi:hypothetical protein
MKIRSRRQSVNPDKVCLVPIAFSNESRGSPPILSDCAIPKGICVLCVLQGT